MEKINFRDFINKKTIIVGDIAKGKTKLTSFIIKYLIHNGYSKDITILDFAPERRNKIGGKIRDYINVEGLRYLSCSSKGPRMHAKNTKELYKLARLNKEYAEKLILEFQNKPTKILIINDLTLYLHAGKVNKIIELIKLTKTFIANAYKGNAFNLKIFEKFNKDEIKKVQKIEKYMDIIIELF